MADGCEECFLAWRVGLGDLLNQLKGLENAAKRNLRYVKVTIDYDTLNKRNKDYKLVGYCFANRVGDHDT